MTIASSAEVLDFLELGADDSFGNVDQVHESVDVFIKSYCGRSFETATFKEAFFHNDLESLFLKETPVTVIKRLAVGERTVMEITNSNKYSTAIVTVSATEVVLTYNGSDDSADLTFASNATVTALVAAINAVGSGWSASVIDDAGAYITTEILQQYGQSAINNNAVCVNVPNEGHTSLDVNVGTGEITKYGAFNNSPNSLYDAGFTAQRVHVTYVAGYTTSNMPEDLKLAEMLLIKLIYGKLTNNEIGLKSLSFAGMSKLFQDHSSDVMKTLDIYKQWRI